MALPLRYGFSSSEFPATIRRCWRVGRGAESSSFFCGTGRGLAGLGGAGAGVGVGDGGAGRGEWCGRGGGWEDVRPRGQRGETRADGTSGTRWRRLTLRAREGVNWACSGWPPRVARGAGTGRTPAEL